MKQISFILGLIFTLAFSTTTLGSTFTPPQEIGLSQEFPQAKNDSQVVSNEISQGVEIQSLTFEINQGEFIISPQIVLTPVVIIENVSLFNLFSPSQNIYSLNRLDNKIINFLILEQIFDIGDVKNNIV